MISEERKQIYLREGILSYLRKNEDYFESGLSFGATKADLIRNKDEYQKRLEYAKEIFNREEDKEIISRLEAKFKIMENRLGVQNERK